MLVVITGMCAALGQNVPSVVLHGDCANELPRYQQWYQTTKLAYGEPNGLVTTIVCRPS